MLPLETAPPTLGLTRTKSEADCSSTVLPVTWVLLSGPVELPLPWPANEQQDAGQGIL